MESDPENLLRLNQFKEMLRDRHTVATFRGPSDLALQVAADLSRTIPKLAVTDTVGMLAALKTGNAAWSQWRRQNRTVTPDLSGAQLQESDLRSIDLRGARLIGTVLTGANLSGADLAGADLFRANLRSANLNGANLEQADLSETDLEGADLDSAIFGRTILSNVDLSRVASLDTILHRGPSSLSIDSIYKSSGKLPDAFLRGVGVPDAFIAYVHSLVGEPIQFYSCFIVHSAKDSQLGVATLERRTTDIKSDTWADSVW